MLLPERTDNEIKNYWNSRLKKILTRMGVDPVTHKPKCGSFQSSRLNHLVQWETTRLEAEARLAHCKKRSVSYNLQPAPPCLDVLKVWQATGSSNKFFDKATRGIASMEGIMENLVANVDLKIDYNHDNINGAEGYLANNDFWNDLHDLVTSPPNHNDAMVNMVP